MRLDRAGTHLRYRGGGVAEDDVDLPRHQILHSRVATARGRHSAHHGWQDYRGHRRLRRNLGSGWPSRQGRCRRGEVNVALLLLANAPSGARRVIESYSFTARFDDQAPEVLSLARWLAAMTGSKGAAMTERTNASP